MSSSKINEAVKEAVIAEVKKLTGYNRKPSGPWVFRKEGIKVKIQGRTLCIYTRDTSITINLERTDSSDLIWQKAAEMLEICGVVSKTESDPKRQKVFNTILGIALLHLNWWLQSLDEKVTDDESIGYVKFWGGVKNTYGENIPSNETSNLIDAKVKKGCTRREYLELIVDEIMAQSADKPTKKEADTYPETVFPDNSVGYYFNQLKEPLRTKALSQAKNLSEPAEGLAWALNTYQILPWDSTVEGSSFWSNVHDYFNSGKTYEDSEGSKLAAQCAPDNYVFPYKKGAPEYIPPTPPVNPIEVALAEIDKLKIRVEMIEYVKDVEIKALRKHHAETELGAKTLANLAYNRVSAFIGQGITPSQSDFETWWTEFRKENGFDPESQKPDYTPTPEQCKALWLLVKEGDKSFPNALPYKFSPHMFQPNVLRVEVLDNFEFSIAPNKFYPFVNSKGERPTFDQCRQAIAGTLAVTLETLFNDGAE